MNLDDYVSLGTGRKISKPEWDKICKILAEVGETYTVSAEEAGTALKKMAFKLSSYDDCINEG